MPNPYLGRGAVVAFKTETTWGTAVTPYRFLKLVDGEIGEVPAMMPSPNLYQQGGWAHSNMFLSRVDTRFRLKLEVLIEGMGALYEHLMWATASSSGTGPYTHAYAMTTTLPVGMTIELTRGTGTAETLSGCMVSKATWSCRAGEPMYLEIEGIAQKAESRTTATSPTFTTNFLPVLHRHMGTIGWNSRTIQATGWTFTLDRKLDRQQLLGSVYTSQPLPSDFAEVMWEIDCRYVDDNLWTDVRAETQSDADVTWTVAANKTIRFDLHNALIVDAVNPPVNRAGSLSQKLRLRGLDDGTDRGAKLTVVNSQSSGIAQ